MPLRGLSPRRRRFVAGCLVIVALLAGGGIALGVAGGGGSQPGGFPPQDRPGTVLLVPGYGGGTGGLDSLAARIRATGRQAVVVQLPDGGTGDLTVEADVLDGYVASALRSAPSVDIVGYSAGGVVARLWVEEHDGTAKARRVITLSSPFHGTTVASAGDAFDPNACPTACQQLVPGSSLLTRLDGTALAGHPPWLSLWTTQDQTVVPPDSARLPGAVDVGLQSVCPDEQASHSAMPTDALAVGLVLRALGTAPLSAPTPADCAALRALGSS